MPLDQTVSAALYNLTSGREPTQPWCEPSSPPWGDQSRWAAYIPWCESLASKDLWAWVRGLLDMFMTHLWLGSSSGFCPCLVGTPRRPRLSVPTGKGARVPALWVSALVPLWYLLYQRCLGWDWDSVLPVKEWTKECTVYTPPWLMGGNSAACLRMSACTPPRLRASTAYLKMSTCTACTPSQLGGLMLPA